MPDTTRHSYLREALTESVHGLVLPIAALLLAGGVFSGRWSLAFLGVVLEGGYLLVWPMLPGFRRSCDERWAKFERQDQQSRFDTLVQKLSANAQSRLRTLTRAREEILTQFASRADGRVLAESWSPRLDALCEAALSLLLAIDSTPAQAASASTNEVSSAEVQRVRAELEKAPAGPLRDALEQRLSLLEAREKRGPKLQEQRATAVVQFETLEDLVTDLRTSVLEGRDANAFGHRLNEVSALVDAARESVNALDAHAAQLLLPEPRKSQIS